MTDIPISIVLNFFLFLLFPFIFAALSKKIKLSPIVGYIVGGLFVGNFFIADIAPGTINNFAYFGIVLLLFTVGLETNVLQMIALKKYIILGGTLQLLFSILAITLVSIFFRFSFLESLLIGIAFSSSSTTLVAKMIQDRGEEHSFVGEIAMGILMFQDIAFIPYLIIFTSITKNNLSFFPVTFNIVKSLVESTIIIASLFYLGKKIIPYLFHRIARASRELLNLFVIIFIFFIICISLILKIPILIGVFVAGVLLAQTLEHHHIFSEVRPIRDILAVIFFVYIGTNIKLPLIIGSLPHIIAFTAFVVFAKALIVLVIFLFMRFHSRTAFSLSLYLFQVDEDAFILMSSSYLNKVISLEHYLFVITSVLLTLVCTPILIKNKDGIYYAIRSFIKKYLPFLEQYIVYRIDRDQSPIDTLQIKNHIVICGYGRIGRYIGKSLMMANIPFVAIDYNFQIVEKGKKEGINIIYGDPSDIDILDYAQVEDAIMLIIALPERLAQESIIMNAKKLNQKIFIISRVHKEADQQRMKDLGVHLVVQPEFEASLSIIRKIYYLHKVPKE
ncbi:cation:proton antiporter, partial [Candidatus Roizmanbacteria bacterium]|nr:cation:proton antiporter [Candidatus Roizmanbacteria bacterium]